MMLFLPVLRTAILGLALASSGVSLSHGQSEKNGTALDFKIPLDPMLTFPGLWELTPTALDQMFSEPGFSKSPYFRWAGRTDGAQDAAVFERPSVSSITADMSIFSGRLPLRAATLLFAEGKAARLVLEVQPSRGGGALGEPETAGLESLWETGGACLGEFFGLASDVPASALGMKYEGVELKSRSWRNERGTALMSFSAEKGLLRIVLAPPTVDPAELAKIPIRELMGKTPRFVLSLDQLLSFPSLWQVTPDRVESTFAVGGVKDSPYYQWLTKDRSGVRFSRKPYANVDVDLTVFNGSVPVDEAVLEFVNGRAARLTISLYNRGDGGQVSSTEFERRYKHAGVTLNKLMGVRPTERRPGNQTAVKISGWAWNGPSALAALEYNTGALDGGNPEFLRLRLASPEQRDIFASETGQSIRKSALGRSALPQFVKRDPNGDTYISGVPMVDQGAKGYCVVASCQRLFGYLRIPCDQHEIAQIAGSDAQSGTGGLEMEEALRKIDSRFKVNFKPLAYRLRGGGLGVPVGTGNRMSEVTFGKFQKLIEDYTAKGIPLLWGLQLGVAPEDPPNAAQSAGGHMRLIIGCNVANDEVIFTDSWGAGHEMKRMKLSDAFRVTMVVYVIEPKEH